jgi:hypothetical protein
MEQFEQYLNNGKKDIEGSEWTKQNATRPVLKASTAVSARTVFPPVLVVTRMSAMILLLVQAWLIEDVNPHLYGVTGCGRCPHAA